MGYRCFEVDVTDKVAHVRLNRPDERNTMVPEFWSELPEIVRSISDSGEARALVLSSTGKLPALEILLVTIPIAAIAGDQVGDMIGRKSGPAAGRSLQVAVVCVDVRDVARHRRDAAVLDQQRHGDVDVQ